MMVRLFKHRRSLLSAAGAAWVACGVPVAAGAAPLSTADFEALAARCAPAVPVATLEAVAKTESGLDPWVIHDNTTKVSEAPSSLQAALSEAGQWISRGDSVDFGLMQINSANLAALGMTARAALDPCASLAGGAAVLQAAYGGGQSSAEQQAALLMALSRYNTGSPFKGILNGYARQVIANANGGTAAPPASPASPAQAVAQTDPNAPPSWNVWATAAYAQSHGAPWLIPLAQAAPATAQAPKSPPGPPTPISPAATGMATVQATSSTQQTQRTP